METTEISVRPSEDPAMALGPVVKSAGRTLQILEYFDRIEREACVTEISRALHCPQSSTSVLLRSLVSMGYLRHDRVKRTYSPTRRVSLLGNWVDGRVIRPGSLLEFVEKLAEQTGQTVVMATPNVMFAQYIYVSRAPGVSEPAIPIGTLRAIERTAVGRALLSTYDRGHVTGLLHRINAERGESAPPVPIRQFVDQLHVERGMGYFTGEGALEGQRGVAMVVDRKSQLLVLAVEGEADEIATFEQDLLVKLRGAASTLSGAATAQPN